MLSEDSASTSFLAPFRRRRAIASAYANGGLWGLGSGLAGSTLFSYLAIEYGAAGFTLSQLFAAPYVVGLLRLATPVWLDRVGDRKRFTVVAFLLSGLTLLALPLVSAPNMLPSQRASLVALVGCWTTYHLLEFFAVVALWSWFRDLVPYRVRGRFVGRRNAWMNAGRVAGTLSGAGATLWWDSVLEQQQRIDLRWTGLAACAGVGAAIMLAAIAPLTRMPNVQASSHDAATAIEQVRWVDLLRPFGDRTFRRFLLYGAWFSMANGLTAAAQRIYMAVELNISYGEKRLLDASSRGLQAGVMPWCGRQIDRCGNVPMLIISQTFVAAAMLFFLIATPGAKWWIVGAYACWIAYAGTNVAQPNLMLGLCPASESPSYTAAWFAWTQLVYAISTLMGGLVLDWLNEVLGANELILIGWPVDRFAIVFVLGLVLKAACVPLAARVPEPLR